MIFGKLRKSVRKINFEISVLTRMKISILFLWSIFMHRKNRDGYWLLSVYFPKMKVGLYQKQIPSTPNEHETLRANQMWNINTISKSVLS
jgi:hypothetical protein